MTHYSENVHSPVANAKKQTDGKREIDYKDPCGIQDIVQQQQSTLKVRKQVIDGKVIYEEPSTEYLKQYNTTIPGVMTEEKRNEIMRSMQQSIQRDWEQKQKDEKVDVVPEPVNFPHMIKICERQAVLENEMKHTAERLRKLEVSSGRRNRQTRHRRRWRKQQQKTNAAIEHIPIQLRDWRYNDILNVVKDNPQSQTPPQ